MAIEAFDGFAFVQRGPLRLYYRADLNASAVLHALNATGQALKRSFKSETSRVGDWVVKRSRLEAGLGPIKRTLARNRYRRAWMAANYLQSHGVGVPAPMAYAEKSCGGIVFANALVTEFLDGCVNVEVFARELVKSADPTTVDDFFSRLASALNALSDARAYHADLSGKNIFTKDGKSFCFIDLDSVILGKTYTSTLRMKNHIQLYDSFCDFCTDATLTRFHAHILPDHTDLQQWMNEVRSGQKARRSHHANRLLP